MTKFDSSADDAAVARAFGAVQASEENYLRGFRSSTGKTNDPWLADLEARTPRGEPTRAEQEAAVQQAIDSVATLPRLAWDEVRLLMDEGILSEVSDPAVRIAELARLQSAQAVLYEDDDAQLAMQVISSSPNPQGLYAVVRDTVNDFDAELLEDFVTDSLQDAVETGAVSLLEDTNRWADKHGPLSQTEQDLLAAIPFDADGGKDLIRHLDEAAAMGTEIDRTARKAVALDHINKAMGLGVPDMYGGLTEAPEAPRPDLDAAVSALDAKPVDEVKSAFSDRDVYDDGWSAAMRTAAEAEAQQRAEALEDGVYGAIDS